MSRQVIRVQYCVDDVFVIPENIDLNNKNQVKDWGVKWNTLHIYFVDGSEIEINSKGWVNDFDYKRPNDDYEPEPAEDFGWVDDDDEGFKPVDVYQPTTEVAEVAKVVEPEPEPEPDRVTITKVDGKKYLKSRNTGNVYDYDIYAKESKQVIVGKWNEEKQQIEFNKIDELEKKYDEAIKNIKLPTAEEIKNMKPTLDAAQLEKLFGN
jgi:hypothetical protein